MAKSKPKRLVTGRRLQRALKLRRQGTSLARIAGELGVSVSTVSRALSSAGDGGERLPAARTGRPRKTKAKRKRKTKPAADDRLAEIRDELDKLGGDAADVLQVIRQRRLPELSRVADGALKGENLVLFRDAVRLEIELAERIIAATPPPPPDPKEDPRNLEARAEVLGQLQRLAEVQRKELAKKLCDSCRAKVL